MVGLSGILLARNGAIHGGHIMQERYFPIGIQSFEKIRQTNAIYVDKMSKNIGESI